MIIESILRDRAEFFAEIRDRKGLLQKNRSMLSLSVLSLAIYGAVMGFSHSLPQALSSLLKLPMLFILTFAI